MGIVVVGAVVVGAVLLVRGPAGVTATPAGFGTSVAGGSSSAAEAPERDPAWDDAEVLDAYAGELGLVMARSRGPEPGAYARRVDGPEPGVETLVARSEDGAAEVVLRLRQHRADCDWLGSSCQEYVISACYRWLFEDSIDDHKPERLGECPAGPVIRLGPAPVEPHLPDDLFDRLRSRMATLDDHSRRAVLAQVRAAYTASRRAALTVPGAEPSHLLSVEEALGVGSAATAGSTVAVAVGQGTECVMVRASPREVDVWVPERVSLLPGEIGCDPRGQLATTGG